MASTNACYFYCHYKLLRRSHHLFASTLLGALELIDLQVDQVRFILDFLNKLNIDLSFEIITLIICSVVIFQYSFMLLQNWIAAKLQSNYLRKLRQETFIRTLNTKWSFLLQQSTGDLIAKITTESSRAASAVYVVVQLTSAIFTTLIFLLIALSISWKLSLILMSGAGLVVFLLYPIMGWARKIGHETTTEISRSFNWLNEILSGAKLIKATASEPHAVNHNDKIENKLEKIQRGGLFQPHLLRAIFESCGILLLLATLAIATQLLSMQAGMVMTILIIFLRLYPRIGAMQHLLQQLYIVLPAVENLNKFNADLEKEQEKAGKRGKSLTTGPIEVENLKLSYGDKTVLNSLTMNLKAGGYYALVGPSGAGKTSLVDCLLGLANPDGGEIRFEGKLISDIGIATWRHSVGYVTQETVLFNMSVAQNIAWNRTEASEEEIKEAAIKANAHEFIAQLPDGYGTIIGERGVTLSGGQRLSLVLQELFSETDL